MPTTLPDIPIHEIIRRVEKLLLLMHMITSFYRFRNYT